MIFPSFFFRKYKKFPNWAIGLWYQIWVFPLNLRCFHNKSTIFTTFFSFFLLFFCRKYTWMLYITHNMIIYRVLFMIKVFLVSSIDQPPGLWSNWNRFMCKYITFTIINQWYFHHFFLKNIKNFLIGRLDCGIKNGFSP
jgi:hypothetical protein